MIFSNKIFRLDKGNNLSIYAISDSELNIYSYDTALKKYSLTTNESLNYRYKKSYNYKKIIELNQNHLCAFWGNSISIIKNE